MSTYWYYFLEMGMLFFFAYGIFDVFYGEKIYRKFNKIKIRNIPAYIEFFSEEKDNPNLRGRYINYQYTHIKYQINGIEQTRRIKRTKKDYEGRSFLIDIAEPDFVCRSEFELPIIDADFWLGMAILLFWLLGQFVFIICI